MRLLMISLDAVAEPDADRLLSLPALSALKADGTFCRHVRTIYPTLTYPIHSSVLTGCYPSRHGIAHNQPFQPDVPKNMRAWHWDIHDIKARTLFDAAKEKHLDCASILWPVTGKAKGLIRRNFPEVLPLPGESPVLKMLSYASPVWVMRMEILYGKTRKSTEQPDLDDYAALLCEQLAQSRRVPDVLCVHLVDIDSMRHNFGVGSLEDDAAQERTDRRLTRIFDAYRKAGVLDDTLICVLSDHGQKNVQNTFALDQALSQTCGARAQTFGMGAYIRTENKEQAKRALWDHQTEWHIARIIDGDALKALRLPSSVVLAVDAEDGYEFIDGQSSHRGDHGFPLTEPEADTLFFLKGPGIPKGKELPSMNIVDIAPTLANRLGLSMPDTDGRILSQIWED